jgi:hypothetical protein
MHKEFKPLGDGRPVRIDKTIEEKLQRRLELLDDLLRWPEHLDNVRTLAELARPPGVKEHEIEETF